MTYRNDTTATDAPGVPFVGLVEPTLYVGEELARGFSAAGRATYRAASYAYRWWVARKTVRELSAMDAHRLEDIGVNRRDLRLVARAMVKDPSFDYRNFSR